MDRFIESIGVQIGRVLNAYEVYQVGGSLRDEIMGRPLSDLDYATSALPEQIKDAFAAAHLPVYPIGEKYGTIKTIIDGMDIEVTTYRAGETYAAGSRHPDVVFGKTIDSDLSRRDFTINAMARSVTTGEMHDPFGGRDDIGTKTIRCVGDPNARFTEDPLRILRAARFATQLGFTIAPETLAAMGSCHPLLKTLSAERIFVETDKILMSGRPADGLRILRHTSALSAIAPACGKCETSSTKVSSTPSIWTIMCSPL